MRVTLDKISKTFPGPRFGRASRPVIPGLDLEIADGKFMVLVGPSGCGKSTILRIIAGLEEPTSGEVYFDDVRVTSLPPLRRNLAFVFQHPALYPHLTIEDNLRFPLRMARTSAQEADQKVSGAAHLLKLTDQLAKRPAQLSGGQRQRAAIGRALVREPRLLLLDEPLSNLDAMLRVEMRAEICALQRELGRTTVYVTHDGEEAMSMGDRVAVLRDGELQQCGGPGDLYSTPANAFVAGFVGNPQMNFVAGKLWCDQEWQVAFGPVRMSLPAQVLARHPRLPRHEGASVIVGFRPETTLIDASAPDSQAMDVVVTGVQQLGKETRVLFPAPRFGVGAGDIPALDTVTHKVGRPGELMMTLTPPQQLKHGQPLRIRVDPHELHLFDALGRAL